MLRVPFLVMEVRPCGNGTNPLDQAIVGGGKPIARQRTDATEFARTFINLSGVWMNLGGTRIREKKLNDRDDKLTQYE